MAILNPKNFRISSPAPSSPGNITIPNFRKRIADLPPERFGRELENILSEIIAWLGNVHGETDGSDEHTCGVMTGQTVLPGTIIFFSSGVCGPASAANNGRVAKAFCTAVSSASGASQCTYTHAGPVVAKLAAGQTSLTRGDSLYLSAITPGALTGSSEETESLYNQECGVFISYVNTTHANVFGRISPPANMQLP
jgi:hypothetical protein